MKTKNSYYKLLILLSIVISIVIVLTFTNIDSDYLWHFTAGKYMINNKTILTHDIFSWSMKNQYWMSHEWLFEVIIFKLFQLFNNFSIYIYVLSSLICLNILIISINKNKYLKNIYFSTIWICISSILITISTPRPQILSLILFCLTIFLLYDLYENENSKKIYFLPFISLIWANIHGGSSNLPYILCFIFLIISSINIKLFNFTSTKKSNKQILTYLIIMLLCISVLIINPHGIKLFLYPYSNINDNLMKSIISEWQPTTINNIGIFYYLLICLIIIIFINTNKNIRLIDFILFGCFVYLGLSSYRFWNYLYITSSFYIFYYVNKPKKEYIKMNIVLPYLIIMILLFGISNINKKNNYVLSNKYIKIIKQEKIKRLYNYYDLGGELIYRNIPVFVDGRADLYTNYNLKDAKSLGDFNKDSIKIINKYNFDYYLIPNTIPLYTYIKNNDNYKLIYKEKNIYLYKKLI